MILQRGEGHGLVCESSNSVYSQLADQRPVCIIGKSCLPRDVSGTQSGLSFLIHNFNVSFLHSKVLEIQQLLLSEIDLLQEDGCCDRPAFTLPTLLVLANGFLPNGG